MKNKLFFLIVLFPFFIAAESIETIYGNFQITEPILHDLLQSYAVNRLKEIHQYGVVQFIHTTKYPYNRYIHSVGVLALLRMFGASLQEQIAGLLHDVSHTVFSHVGDHVYAQLKKKEINQNDEAYQDNMHLWYIAQTDIAPILQRYHIALEAINHKNGTFAMLEQELPEICADRLEYNLYGAYIEGWIDQKEIQDILHALHFKQDQWFFNDTHQARKFAEISIRLCQLIFAPEWNIGSYEWAAKALLRAVELQLISLHDIHFGIDKEVWHLLCASQDAEIKQAVRYVLQAKTLYQRSSAQLFDLKYVSKFRGIDPWVQTEQGLQRLTDIDTSFAYFFDQAKKKIATTQFYRQIYFD